MMEDEKLIQSLEPEETPSEPAPPPPANMTLASLLEILHTSGIDYRLLRNTDEPSGKTFVAGVASAHAVAAEDPVTALLQAMALGMRAEAAHAKKRATEIGEFERVAKFMAEKIPELSAYLPKGGKQKPCDTCGEFHGDEVPEGVRRMRDIVQAALTGAGFPGAVQIERVDPKDKDKKPPEN